MDAHSADLRRVLNTMFPPNFIERHHRPPASVCSLFATRTAHGSSALSARLEASSEPSSRAGSIALGKALEASLEAHQAKPVGLCPIRRAIYDQCFDEIIRQVTVGCVELGLLLLRVRNELRLTISCYRRAYESGVKFGLAKAMDAELEMQRSSFKISQLEAARRRLTEERSEAELREGAELKNGLEVVERTREYFERELKKKEQIIEQQRIIIRALSRKSISDLQESPISG